MKLKEKVKDPEFAVILMNFPQVILWLWVAKPEARRIAATVVKGAIKTEEV